MITIEAPKIPTGQLPAMPKLSRADIRRAQKANSKKDAKFYVSREELAKMVQKASDRRVAEMYPETQERIFNTLMTSFFYVLHESEGYGEKRLIRVRKAWDGVLKTCITPDPDGLPYLRFEDMASYLADRYNGLDINKSECIKADESNVEALFREKYRIGVKAFYEFLMQRGHEDAANDVREWWKEAWEAEQ